MIEEIIRFYVDCYIKVEGEHALSNGVIKRTRDAIEEYKEQSKGRDIEYEELVDVACEHLETEGYTCNYVPHIGIEL